MEKDKIIKLYNLTKEQVYIIDAYLSYLSLSNSLFNLVGSSTLDNAWDRHINDSLQLSEFIKDKNSSIIDFGTGAGLPGLILSIYGYKNILLVDSKLKKIQFINSFIFENKINTRTLCKRVDQIKNKKFEIITSRAFSPLVKLLNYSLLFSKKGTTLLFLKGRSVNNEIRDAKKFFDFEYNLFKSKSDGDGFVLKLNKFVKL